MADNCQRYNKKDLISISVMDASSVLASVLSCFHKHRTRQGLNNDVTDYRLLVIYTLLKDPLKWPCIQQL